MLSWFLHLFQACELFYWCGCTLRLWLLLDLHIRNMVDTTPKPQSHYQLRPTGPRLVQNTYKRQILSSVLCNNILPLCDLPKASWQDPSVFENMPMHHTKTLVQDHLADFERTRTKFIRESFYWQSLKATNSIENETKLISDFVESRRKFWNYIPAIGRFSIQY